MRYWKARLGLSLAVFALPLLVGFTAAYQDTKVKKPDWKHAVGVKVREAGKDKFDGAKKIGIEVYYDPNSDKTLFVSETGSVAVRPGGKDIAGKGKTPEWSHAMDLAARKAGEKKFEPTTKKYGVEVYFDPATNKLLYVCETGSVAVVEGQKLGKEGKGPDWSHAMDLKVRKAGEKMFGPQTQKFGVEVYHDVNNGNLVYITENGSLAVIKGDKATEGKDPTWKAAMDLKVRKAKEPDFGPDTKKHGIEVYLDENNGNLIFITEAGNIFVTKATVANDKADTQSWKYGLETDARKGDEKDFGPNTQRYGMEIYDHERTGLRLYVTERSTLAGDK
jgi:hypothetical protein